ncbi:head-tail adaptor protein [Sulfitobacter sp. TB366]|uniref:head-tail adaptor protein n=1 Tax=Sulfitobacter sp. TB366 TaxID=3368580 RepID=UPI0037457FA3
MGELRARVQFRRAGVVDDGFSNTEAWADHGNPQRARRSDVSDSEKWRAGAVGATISARFVVRRTDFTAGLTPKDRLTHKGQEFEITGIRALADAPIYWLEISATAEAD